MTDPVLVGVVLAVIAAPFYLLALERLADWTDRRDAERERRRSCTSNAESCCMDCTNDALASWRPGEEGRGWLVPDASRSRAARSRESA